MKGSTRSKLVELRAKTDGELLSLVRPELKRALVLANVAATRESAFYLQAQKIVDVITTLLPTIPVADRRERALLEDAIKEVRLALARLAPPPTVACARGIPKPVLVANSR
jgi:hypothetical protein